MESPLCPPDTRLIETFAWRDGHAERLDRHLARARASAAALGFFWDERALRAALARLGGTEARRVRLTIGPAGDAEVTLAPMPPAIREWRVRLASARLRSTDPLLAHKTTARGLYDRARAALPEGVDEAIFANERGEVCEGAITNVFFDLGAGLSTPPLTSGCLPGILRAEMLAAGACREAVLPVGRLGEARLWLGNALRGLAPARILP